jgi:hypothetical protein
MQAGLVNNSKFYYCENQKTYIAVLFYFGSIMAKAIKTNVENGLDTCQNKAVILAG